MRSWKERFPERFEHELAAFAERGLDFEPDRELLEERGQLVLRGEIEHEGEAIALEVVYPDLFPYLRPEVLAKERRLDRHQNPYDGNLCLLERSSRAWDPSCTGAWLVAERVPYLLGLLEAGEEEMRRAEAPQGEPVSSYFPSAPGTAIFVPEAALELPKGALAGSGRIGFAPFEPPRLRVRGLVAELVEKRPGKRKTRTLAKADAPLRARFCGEEIPFRWVRLGRAPEQNRPDALLEEIEAARPGFGSPPWGEVPGGAVAIAAAVFAEEVRQGVYEDTWVFVVKLRQDQGGDGLYLVRGERLSRADLEARLPDFVRLGERRASLAGLGALGGELAITLAKAGLGSLRGLDFDAVEAGTTSRWVGGLTAVGHLKTEYLRQRIAFDYPYTEFEAFPLQLGGSAIAAAPRAESELETLARFLDGTDLLIDTTAEIGIQQALAAEADEVGIPQLYVSATEGARGGLVARVDPGHGGCWLCLQHHIEDGSIAAPAHAEPLTLQPRGCSTLTYSGAGYDLLPIVAQGARVAVATLAGGADAEGSEAFVCSFPEDRAGPPSWSTHPFECHPKCALCKLRQR